MYGVDRRTEPADPIPPRGQSRRRQFLVLLAVLLATLLLHAGIAYALRSPSAPSPSHPSSAAAQKKACQSKPAPSNGNATTPNTLPAPGAGGGASDPRSVL
jgi:hypothetical protein